jgi:adenylate cyclase
MPDLLAQGQDDGQCWRRTLPAQAVTLGRTSRSDWDVPWDKQISGLHATLVWQEGKLWVRREPSTRNAIFVRGTASDEFRVAIGEQFVIGGTAFTVKESEPEFPTPLAELTCSRQELQKVKYTDADQRIEVLAALPGIIRYSPSEEELENRVVDVLLRGIPRANTAAVVWLNLQTAAENCEIKVRAVARRDRQTGEFQPSRRLILDAVSRRRQSVLHSVFARQQGDDFTVHPGADWAICAPLPDDPSPGWGLYVTGHVAEILPLVAQGLHPPLPPLAKGGPAGIPPLAKGGPGGVGSPSAEDFPKSDLKFAELVADIFGALRQVRDLQHRQSTLASFLSRPVLAALAGADMAEVLRPRETQVTVLFCDLRSSCRLAEEGEPELALTCARLNEALSIMTTNIVDKDGVISDFQGDAAMGFWGWPLPTDDQMEQAARAALAIQRDIARAAQKPGHPLAGFTCGIGIANGLAIAGKLGTLDQFKVGVFGPVVNLASRLESMTKLFRVPILVDECVAQRLASGRNSHWVRCRRLARVQPYGLRKALLVSELLPPTVEPGAMAERDRRDYEAALDAFLASRWADARRLLDRLPQNASFFVKEFMDRHGQKPPAEWNGVIALETK